MIKYLGELNDVHLQLTNHKNESQDCPLVGVFKNDFGYYVVLAAEEHGKTELIMYRLKREGETEHLETITDRLEWDAAYAAWVSLYEEADRIQRIVGQ